jgi:hypothetical protein
MAIFTSSAFQKANGTSSSTFLARKVTKNWWQATREKRSGRTPQLRSSLWDDERAAFHPFCPEKFPPVPALQSGKADLDLIARPLVERKPRAIGRFQS